MANPENENRVLARVDMMLDSLDRLAQTERSPAQFYAELLGQLKIVLTATDCCILASIQPGRWNSLAATSAVFGAQAAQHLTAFAKQKATILSARWVDEEQESRWIGYGLHGVNWTAGGIVAMLPLVSPVGSPANTRAMHELLEAFAEILNRFQLKHGFTQADPRSSEIRSIAGSILACKTAKEADRGLVDGARCCIDADRVTLLRWGSPSDGFQTLAISGHPRVDTQSNFVHSLQRRLNSTNSDIQSSVLLTDWAKEIGSAIAISYPIESGPASGISPDGSRVKANSLLVLEWFEEERYVHNAMRIESGLPWLTVAWQSHTASRSFIAVKSRILKWIVVAVVVSCFALYFASPTELTILSQGTLQPTEQRFVFAPAEGYVDKILVADGQLVRLGEIIATLESPQLQLQINQVSAEIGIVGQKRDGINITLNQLKPADDQSNVTGSRLAGEVQELETRRQNLLEQKKLLEREQERLQLRSPIVGTVIAWEVERHLENRPVRRGDLLFRIASLEEKWRIESTIADWESGYVVEAQRAKLAETKPLTVEFVFASASKDRGTGKIEKLSNTMRDVNGSQQLDVVVAPDARIENPRLGTSATVSIPCGQFPRWFVWTRSILDAIRRRFWL